MRNGKIRKNFPRVFKTVSFTLLLLAITTSVWAQAQNWWVLPSNGAVERGKLEEIKLKKKVFLNVTFETSGPGQITSTSEQSDIRKNVSDAFKGHKDLTVVLNPATADFAVIVKAAASTAGAENEHPANFSISADADSEISVDVTVLVPGAKLADGTFKSRSVWQVSSPNVQMEAGAGARFVVNGFLWELNKLRTAK
jgi:hypothetical protein